MGMAGFQAEMESNGDGKEMEAPWMEKLPVAFELQVI
jgi:hypothetical protein